MAGLWTGTAVFAANKSRTFGGFLKTFLTYAVVLVLGIYAVMWVLRMLGMGREGFTEPTCQAGETETPDCYGEKGCMKPSGNCYKLLSSA